MKKLTPVLVVDAIEPCLPFWCERFGFAKTVEVSHGAQLGFVILSHGPIELMLQSRASMLDDLGAHAMPRERDDLARGAFRSALYIEVDDLAPLRKASEGLAQLFPERTTFYGAREIGVRDPAGNVVVFAQQASDA